MSSRLPVLMSVAALVAIAAAMVEQPGMAVAGASAVLGLAAAHPAVRDRGVPRSTRLLLLGTLVLVAATVAETWDWRVSGDTRDLIALLRDPGWQREQFLRQAVVAGCLVLACACLGVAAGRLPRERLRPLGPAVAVVVPGTLLALVLVPLIIALVGPITAAAEVVCVLGGYAWLVRRTFRRHGAAAIAAVGGTPLVLLTWLAVDQAWRSRPDPPRDGNVAQPAYAVAVGVVDSGPDIASGGALAALLLGAVLTVLACARLARADDPAIS